MVSRLRSRWLFTALPTPTPPTKSAVRPTMVRNCVKRSTLRSSCGEALLRPRMSQPAAGLQQAGRAQRGFAHQQARSEADAAGELVGLAREDSADLERRATDAEPV